MRIKDSRRSDLNFDPPGKSISSNIISAVSFRNSVLFLK